MSDQEKTTNAKTTTQKALDKHATLGVQEQHATLPTQGEVRKNVNVLNTAGSENPSLNPFLQNQSTQTNTQNSSTQNQQNSKTKE